MKEHSWSANLLLLITAMIWGGSFIVVKEALSLIHPLQVIAYRFTLAFIFLLAFYHKRALENWKDHLIPGVSLGFLLGSAFIAQTYGLSHTAPSTSAFITGLNVVLVAVFQAAFYRRTLPCSSIFGVLLATVGLSILTWNGRLLFSLGELLTLCCAVLFALHIVATGKVVSTHRAETITLYQSGAVALAAWILLLFCSPQLSKCTLLPLPAWPALIYLGFLSTGVAYLFQTLAQRRTTPVHTAIILSAEPAFAALFTVLLGYEELTCGLVLGGFLIIVGMILTSK
ncbi:MAG TPA: DMT family transporter [Firmicutes bacterium]|nr:DMT family transporter [Bacillota bacterium]